MAHRTVHDEGKNEVRQRQRNLKWEKTRQRGRKAFLYRYGVFGWGLWTGILVSVLNVGMNNLSFKFLTVPQTLFTIMIYIVLFMLGVYIWGIFMWNWMERHNGNRK